MNLKKKLALIMKISGILLLSIILSGCNFDNGEGSGQDTPPNIYVSTEAGKTKETLIGGYSWKNGDKHIEADSDHPVNFEYTLDNTISVASKEQLLIDTQKLKSDEQYDFTVEEIAVYSR